MDRFTVAAQRTDVRGGEAVMAARLSGKQPIVYTVRDSADTRQITTDWRVTDVDTGSVGNVRTITAPAAGWLDVLCEVGVAT